MKLNSSYLGVQFETQPILKDLFLSIHLDERHKAEIMMQPLLATVTGAYYDHRSGKGPWEMRSEIAHSLATSPKDLRKYFITQTVQQGAAKIKFDFDKVDLRMFKKIKNMSALYITGKDEFFRFEKTDERINILHMRKLSDRMLGRIPDVNYDSYSIILEEKELHLGMLPGQDKEGVIRFVKLLLFIEVAEIEYYVCRAGGGKVVYGKGDDKLKNETGMEVTVVNSSWNKVILIEGNVQVTGYFRCQWVGEGRKELTIVWVNPYVRGPVIRNAGKINTENNSKQNDT